MLAQGFPPGSGSTVKGNMMKRSPLFFALLLLTAAGCASSDRMVRMSGGVFDEYSAPKSSRLRSEKYQRVSRELSSSSRANRSTVSGMDDTLVNIWPFFFRSNAYWTVLWPFIDCDRYGFAIRPIYNHEGDDYSILFPLSAWNPVSGHGWVALWGWNSSGFGLLPLTWQWRNGLSGGAYYTPLFVLNYDGEPLRYAVDQQGNAFPRWSRTDHSLFCFFYFDKKSTSVERGDRWRWLYQNEYPWIKNEWNYRFDGKKPFPGTKKEFQEFRRQIFDTLPRVESRTRGFVPLWLHGSSDNGDYDNRFLLIAGNERRGKDFRWDICGSLIARYEDEHRGEDDRFMQSESSFTSFLLLSEFSARRMYEHTETWKKIDDLHSLPGGEFSGKKPALQDALRKLDPSLKLPPTVVDRHTCILFLNELWRKYRTPVYEERSGMVLPLFSYDLKWRYSRWILPILLTGWETDEMSSDFLSLPLITGISRSPSLDRSFILTPLVYYAKCVRRERREYPVASRDRLSVRESVCTELNDRYAACGLFFRGRYGFNVAKEGVNASAVEKLRVSLQKLPRKYADLERRRKELDKQQSQTDRWVTNGEIERLKKLIRYEEIKIARQKLAGEEKTYRTELDDALRTAATLGITLSPDAMKDEKTAEAAADEVMEKCTESRTYEDIGSGLFFKKTNYSNGDFHWHLLHILAGGEKTGDRESSHVLHLLYRHRREGDRSETVFFPFISTLRDGEDSKFSFLWRVFSLTRRNGKTGGHILFIPFGEP